MVTRAAYDFPGRPLLLPVAAKDRDLHFSPAVLRAPPVAETSLLCLDRLLNHKELTIQDAEVVTDALTRFKKRPALGFSDCLFLEVARKAGHCLSAPSIAIYQSSTVQTVANDLSANRCYEEPA